MPFWQNEMNPIKTKKENKTSFENVFITKKNWMLFLNLSK